eukprot:gene10861-12651_t
MDDPTSDSMFYSPTFKRYESVTFYANLLSILKQYTVIVDQCPPMIRKLIWSQIFQLLGQPQRQCDIPFTPVINSWLGEKSVDLMDIETYFAAFTQAQIDNASIFPQFPAVSSLFYIPESKIPSVWGTELSSVFSQLSLLQSWCNGLERLNPKHKDLVWRTCRSFSDFINYDRASFTKTLQIWTLDPVPNLSHITVLFAAVGYLKEMGVIRSDFFYCNSSVPVFASSIPGMAGETNTPPMSPHYDLSSDANTPESSSQFSSPPSSPHPNQANNSNTSSNSTPNRSPVANRSSNNSNSNALPLLPMNGYSSPVHTPSSTPQYLSPRPSSTTDSPISPKNQQLSPRSMNLFQGNNNPFSSLSNFDSSSTPSPSHSSSMSDLSKKRKSVEDTLNIAKNELALMVQQNDVNNSTNNNNNNTTITITSSSTTESPSSPTKKLKNSMEEQRSSINSILCS